MRHHTPYLGVNLLVVVCGPERRQDKVPVLHNLKNMFNECKRYAFSLTLQYIFILKGLTNFWEILQNYEFVLHIHDMYVLCMYTNYTICIHPYIHRYLLIVDRYALQYVSILNEQKTEIYRSTCFKIFLWPLRSTPVPLNYSTLIYCIIYPLLKRVSSSTWIYAYFKFIQCLIKALKETLRSRSASHLNFGECMFPILSSSTKAASNKYQDEYNWIISVS